MVYRPHSDEFVLFISLYIPYNYDNIDYNPPPLPWQYFERLINSNIVTLQNLSYNFIPQNEIDYVNYLKIILGRSDQPTKPSETIQSFVSANHINEENVVDKVVLVFMNASARSQ